MRSHWHCETPESAAHAPYDVSARQHALIAGPRESNCSGGRVLSLQRVGVRSAQIELAVGERHAAR